MFRIEPLSHQRRAADVTITISVLNGLGVLGLVSILDCSGNSSREGFRPFTGPTNDTPRPPQYSQLVHLCGTDVENEAQHEYIRSQLADLVTAQLRFFSTLPSHLFGTLMARNNPAEEATVKALTSVPFWCDDRPLSLHLAKDITKSDILGLSSYSGTTLPAARAGWL